MNYSVDQHEPLELRGAVFSRPEEDMGFTGGAVCAAGRSTEQHWAGDTADCFKGRCLRRTKRCSRRANCHDGNDGLVLVGLDDSSMLVHQLFLLDAVGNPSKEGEQQAACSSERKDLLGGSVGESSCDSGDTGGKVVFADEERVVGAGSSTHEDACFSECSNVVERNGIVLVSIGR